MNDINIHLRILLGPDRRYNLVDKTTRICEKYFTSIGVLNTGPELYYTEILEILPSYVNLRQHKDFFDIECARRHMISDVPENDWVLWLDGDETPSQELLDNLQKIVLECEEEKYDVVTLPWYLHMDGQPSIEYDEYYEKHASRNFEEYKTTNKHYFSPKRFIKNIKENYITSNWGVHELFWHHDEKVKYYGYLVNHFKTTHDWAQSPVYHLFMNPLVHNRVGEKQIFDVTELEIFKKLEEFKIKYNTYTASEFIKQIVEGNNEYIEDFKSIFDSIEYIDESVHQHASEDIMNPMRLFYMVKTFIEKYDFKWILNPSYPPCGKRCCKYDGNQY